MKLYPIHISLENNYCWFELPKCASCTIRQYLNKHTKKSLKEGQPFSLIEYKKEYLSLFNFAFVRNPFSRLVSCWVDKVRDHARWSKNRRQSDPIHYLIDNNYSFKQFITKICSEKNFLDAHWRPLIDYLPEKHIESISIFNIEDFQKGFNAVCDKIGTPKQKMSKKNNTKHSHYTTYYDDESRRMVESAYAKDVKYFGKFGE